MTVHPPPASTPSSRDGSGHARQAVGAGRAARPMVIEVEGVRYRIRRTRTSLRRAAWVCESPPGAPIAPCATRREVRLRLDGDGGGSRSLVVFTDAARTAEIWSWVSPEPGGSIVPHERARRTGAPEEVMVTLLATSHPDRRAYRAGRPALRDVARLVSWAVLRRVNRACPALLRPGGPVWRLVREAPDRYGLAGFGEPDAPVPPAEPLPSVRYPQLLHDLIADCGGPDAVRAVWRAALGLRVLDPRCGPGDWLMAVMEALEPIYGACLERMQLWVDETALSRTRRRADSLRDLRSVLARATDVQLHASPLGFVRETVALWNLYGADPRGRMVATCSGRIRRRIARLAAGGVLLPPSSLNLWVGDPHGGLTTRAEAARALGPAPERVAALDRVTGEADACERAGRLLRRMRLQQGLGVDTVAAGLDAVRARAEAAMLELDALRSRGMDLRSGAPRARRPRPLHPLVAWPAVAGSGGFDLIRAAEGG